MNQQIEDPGKIERGTRRRRRWRVVPLTIVLLIFALVGFNGIAYLHAHAMLTFADTGVRTNRPTSLSMAQKARVLLTGVTIPRPENKRTPASAQLRFETHLIPVGETVVIEAWSIPVSEAKGAVILFHGYGAAKASLLPEAEAFHKMGFDSVLVDFRGSGGSSERDTTIGYLEGEDVAAAVAFARTRFPNRPIVLYGQSMGAAAVLRAIHAHGVQADAIILEAVFDRLLTTVRNRFSLMKLPSFPAAETLVFWGGVQAGFEAFDHDPVEYATNCRCPALLLHGEDDLNARLDGARNVQRQLGSGTHLEVFPGVGHASTFTADPRRWRDAVTQFLNDEKLSGAES